LAVPPDRALSVASASKETAMGSETLVKLTYRSRS
jgi:hypothetical protein